MSRVVAVLTTLDTKGPEAAYLREEVEAHGGRALLIDMGVVGVPAVTADVGREELADAGGVALAELLIEPTREKTSPVMVRGATQVLIEKIGHGEVHAVLGLGGTQGTSNCTAVMQALPYGFPKLMVSTVASGDTSPFVGIKDITMMFSVADILGLNRFTRRILANAAGAALGMARVDVPIEPGEDARPLVGMTNLGVLTEGAMEAIRRFEEAGYEVLVFHAVGSGGRAMEQMMKDGLLRGVFDYALGEISDELFDGLRAGGEERLTVASELGLPQVLCPGGAEHVGIMVDEPNVVPEAWSDHRVVWHNPIILAPRLTGEELVRVAQEIARRLGSPKAPATFLFPRGGTSRYAVPGGPLHDPEGDEAFRSELAARLAEGVEFVEHDAHAEDPAFVGAAVDLLVAAIEEQAASRG